MIRGWHRGAAAAVLLGACSRVNPAYEGDGPAAEASGGTTGLGTGSTTGDASAEDGPEPTTSGAEGSSGDTTAGETGEVGTCMFPARFDIMLPLDLEQALGQCGDVGSLDLVPLGMPNGGALAVGLCPGGCPCGPAGDYDVTFQGPIPPLLPPCFTLQVQYLDDPILGCILTAYSILEGETALAVASNVIDPMVSEPFGFTIAGQPSEPCMGSCDPGSGQYVLHSELGGGLDVPPDGLPKISTSGPVTYDVVNLGSGIDGACNQLGRWFAVEQPG